MASARAVGLKMIAGRPKRTMIARYPVAPPCPSEEDSTATRKMPAAVSRVNGKVGSKELLYSLLRVLQN